MELLVVIVIIATLSAVSTGVMFKFRKSADKATAMNNLRQLQAANVSYAVDNNGQFVPPTVEEVDDSLTPATAVNTSWYENPELISELKGEDATYNTTSGETDVTLDEGFMDPAVVRERDRGFDSLDSSFGYTLEVGTELRQSQLTDAARSAAFITADSGFVTQTSKSNIAYRHSDKALVVFYDGHAIEITETAITAKTATDIFWDPIAQ